MSLDIRISSGRHYRESYDRDRYYDRDRCYDGGYGRAYYRRDYDYDRDRCYRR